MDDHELTETLVVRDNTTVLLTLVMFVFVTMVILTILLVRFGNLNRSLNRIIPSYTPPRFQGGGDDVRFFYMN